MTECNKCLPATRNGKIVYYICRNQESPLFNQQVSPKAQGVCQGKKTNQKVKLKVKLEVKVDSIAYTPGVPRPDLAAIVLTLPPDDCLERSFRRPIFEPDGALKYPKKEGDWEPPHVPNGYVRDKDDAWRFLPLWLPCVLRHQAAYLNANCGCIEIIMRCNHPDAKTFGRRLDAQTCKICKLRRTS
jgi:hypothetical protein